MAPYSETIFTSSPEETIEAGIRLGKRLTGGEVIAYKGGLGAGKTTFTRGLAMGMGLEDNVSSPTFAIVNEYHGAGLSLCHFDMYRISGEDDLYSIGFYDYSDCVMAVEWSERILYALPPFYYKVEFAPYSGDGRDITVSLVTQRT